jgi:hypothetical protein
MSRSERFTRSGRKLEKRQDRVFLDQEGVWGTFETGFTHYMEDLGPLEYYPGEVLDALKSSKRPVVVDIMSSTGMLQDLLVNKLLFKQGKYIAVGHYDNRNRFREDRDDALGIKFIEGGIRDPKTWTELRKNLDSDEADFVFSRPLGGLYFVPTKNYFGYHAFNEAYGLLKDGGSIITQVPPISALEQFGIPIERWLAQLESSGVPYKHIPQYASATDTKGGTYGLLRIDRVPGIPELPTVDIRRQLIHQAA